MQLRSLIGTRLVVLSLLFGYVGGCLSAAPAFSAENRSVAEGAPLQATRSAASKIQGACVITFTTKNWSDRSGISLDEAMKAHRFDFSSKETFKRLEQRTDTTERLHQGEAPKELRPFDVQMAFEKKKDVGWPNHEKLILSLSILTRANNQLIAGPYKASVFRRTPTSASQPPDGFPMLTVPVVMGGLEVQIGAHCGGDIRT